MGRRGRSAAIVLSAAVCLLAASGASATTPAQAAASGYVVVLHDGVQNPAAETSDLQRRDGFVPQLRYASALKGFSAQLTDQQVARLRAEPAVAYVVTDAVFQAAGTDPVAAGDTVPVGVRRIGAASTTLAHQAANSAVAVLDTGIDLANADLNATGGINCVRSGNPPQDDNGHGTNVAGIIAARNNGSGVVGVAPGTRLYAVKVLGPSGNGTLSQVLCGIDWVSANAASLNITVANMSLTGRGTNDDNCGRSNNDAEHQAICNSTRSGVTYVAAAGNDSTTFAGSIPAAYPEVLTATAMSDSDGAPGGLGGALCQKGERDDYYATYSNYAVSPGDQAHTLAAPGTCVVSDKRRGGTVAYSGTSQAAPHVAGAVALCLGNGGVAGPCAGLAPGQVITKLLSDAAPPAATLSYGFVGDPWRPLKGNNKYFGYLVTAAGY